MTADEERDELRRAVKMLVPLLRLALWSLEGERRQKPLRPGLEVGPVGNVIDRLEDLWSSTHRQDRHRKPPRPS